MTLFSLIPWLCPIPLFRSLSFVSPLFFCFLVGLSLLIYCCLTYAPCRLNIPCIPYLLLLLLLLLSLLTFLLLLLVFFGCVAVSSLLVCLLSPFSHTRTPTQTQTHRYRQLDANGHTHTHMHGDKLTHTHTGNVIENSLIKDRIQGIDRRSRRTAKQSNLRLQTKKTD